MWGQRGTPGRGWRGGHQLYQVQLGLSLLVHQAGGQQEPPLRVVVRVEGHMKIRDQ